MQATISTVPCEVDTMLSIYADLYRYHLACTYHYGWETPRVLEIMSQQIAKLVGHLKLIGKKYLRYRVIFGTEGMQSGGNILVNVSSWNVDCMSISGPKFY